MSALPTGLYQPGQSLIHRLCPWVKILCLLILLTAVVTTDTLWGYGLVTVLTVLLLRSAALPVETVLSPVRRLRWFFLMIFLMNLCFYGPEDPWFRLWLLTPSFAGLMQGVHVVLRVFLLLLLANLLTSTTAPLAMTDAMQTLLSPLGLLKIPVGQIAMILSVAVQFIPTLFEEADAIRKAQTARGAKFDSRRLRDKAAAVVPLVVPIFLAAFKRADELSLAMEARGYRPGLPMRRKKQPIAHRDVLALATCTALCLVQILYL